MTSDRPATLPLTAPRAEGWDFGDFPYGLEPLTLPHPDEPVVPESFRLSAEVDHARLIGSVRGDHAVHRAVDNDDLERVFWFRWITGHHVTFIIWRLLAEACARLSAGVGDRRALSRAIVDYVHGYSAMLLYTGSTTQKIYNETIRPSMYRTHSAFSGTWSADYAAVRGLLRGRKVPPMTDPEQADLEQQVRLCRQVHLGVASNLVAGGRSLLQQSVADPRVGRPRIWTSLFDCYFLTLRAPVSAHEIVTQLLRRTRSIEIDLSVNGLYPEVAHYSGRTPEELRTPEVLACERNMTDTVLHVAALAGDSALEGSL